MKKQFRAAAACSLALLFLFTAWAAPALANTTLVMGTGKVAGDYNAFGVLLAQVVNAQSAKTGISIKLVKTEGSVANLSGLASNQLQLAMAQADVLPLAMEGRGPWAKLGKQKGLRCIYDVYNEGLTCVVSEASGIKNCAGLKGKRVALGAQGSGTLVNSLQALKLCHLTPADLDQALYVSQDQAMRLMFDGKLDAFFYTVGHPNPTLRKFVEYYEKACFVPLVPSGGMKHGPPFYKDYFILKNDYPMLNNREVRIATFGIENFLMTNDKVPEQVIYEVASLLMKNLPLFKEKLPFMDGIKPPVKGVRKLNNWNAAAPYHPGFLKLYKEMNQL
ncbi:MAG: TAXI family TRAP transporter solute-binding subunit [Desulfarculaceae bacterium]|nr:TAXI family TRAP transporter solute-binding subunit [Desulfarculaceae bacterium]